MGVIGILILPCILIFGVGLIRLGVVLVTKR
jgi:hypothetical protein